MDAANEPAGATGESLYLSHRHAIERVIAFVCGRNRLSQDEAEEFASEVRLKLVQGDYAVLRKHEGRSSMATYLAVVIQRLFLDYRVKLWGKWRPSAEARRAGPVGIALDRLLTRDGLGFDDAIRQIEGRFGAVDRVSLERVAAALPVRTRRVFEGEEALDNVPSSAAPAEARVVAREAQAMADRLAQAIRTLTGDLDTRDQLLLRLRYEDGRTVPEIASVLRVETKPLYRQIDRLLGHLKRRLEEAGLTSQDVEVVLARPEAVEWDSTDRGIAGSSPSPL